MSQEKYIGMDVHQATISVAVMDQPTAKVGAFYIACNRLITEVTRSHVSRDPKKKAAQTSDGLVCLLA